MRRRSATWRGLLRIRHVAEFLLLPVALISLWEWIPPYLGLPRFLMPTASETGHAWYLWVFGQPFHGLYSGTWLSAVEASATRVLSGFAIGGTIGLVLGVLIGWSGTVSRIFDPTIQWLRPIPLTAWVPIAILWFGIRTPTALFLISLGVFYPVVVSAAQSVRLVDRNLVRAGRMLGSSGPALLLDVVLPAAMPSMLGGLRVALGFAWLTVVISEMLAVRSGLGYALWDAYYFSRTDIVIAAMLSVGLAGFISDGIFRSIMGRILSWTKGRSVG
jgi:NitT/TauT family transport system permease protein